MPGVMEQLQTDHSNFRTLMEILEEELNQVDTGKVPNFDLVREIMRYMVHYADWFHHPLEDLVFARLQAKDDSTADTIRELEREHAAFADRGRALLEVLEADPMTSTIDWTKIDARARGYVDALLGHKDREDEVVFPLAKTLLSEEDWAAIGKEIEWREDPVFGKSVAEGYMTLYHRLTRED